MTRSTLIQLLFFMALVCGHSGEALEAAAIEIPLRIDKFGMPLVDLTIMGESERFILDTGSRKALHIPKSMMINISGLQLTDKQKSIDMAGKQRESQQFVIPSLEINGLRFTDLAGEELQSWGLSIGVDNNGNQPYENFPIAGLGLFNDHWIVIDYKNGLLTISDTDEYQACDGWVDVSFKLMDEGLALNMVDERKSYVFILDTGATTSIIKAGSLPSHSKLMPGNEHPKWSKSIDEGVGELRFKAVSLEELADKPTYYALVLDGLPDEFKADGLLGTDFFENVVIKFNIKQKNFKLKKSY